MTHTNSLTKKPHLFKCARLGRTLFLVVAALGVMPAPAVRAIQAVPDISPEPAELVQFTAGGHVLGFQPDGVYLAGGDHVLKVTFDGAAGVTPVADQPPSSDGQAQPLGRVTYTHLWDGISLTYEQTAGGLAKSSYLLEPGARVDQIRLRYNVPVQVGAGGELLFGFETGQMSESAPVAWQDINGQRIPVDVTFHIVSSPLSLAGRGAGGEGLVGFALGEYNPTYPLIIDPILQWHTFLGAATGMDEGYAIAIDGSGDIYLSGYSEESWGTPLSPFTGSGVKDILVAKLNSSGALQWHTFLGSSDYDNGCAIGLDGSGNVYVGGYSHATWGTPLNDYEGGSADAFVAKLNSDGTLLWHTFVGGTSLDYGRGMAVDASGNVYLTGRSTAGWGSPKRLYAGGADTFAAKLNSSGTLLWNTFLGSSNTDYGRGIAADGSGNVYVAGYSRATWGSPARPYAGGYDAFVAQLDSSDGDLQWNTFMGGTGADYSYGIAVDGSGDVYLSGYSNAAWGAPVNAHAGGGKNDVFAAKLNSSGALQWHTFMGSTEDDSGRGIAVDGSGNMYVAGFSSAAWGSPANLHAGGRDAFVARLNSSSGALQWHTFMGGTGNDAGIDIAITADGSGAMYLTGYSNATWGAPLNAHAGSYDALVARLGSGIAKHVDNDMPQPGALITYTLRVYNETFTNWTGAVISDTLPTEVAFAGPVTVDPPQPGATLAQSAGDLPTLASGLTITARQHITLTFPVTLSLGTENQTITNTASVTSAQVLTLSHGSRSIVPTLNIRVTHSASEADQPDVATDSIGNVHIAYCDYYGTDTYEIWYVMLDAQGNTLIDETLITPDDGSHSRRPAIVVDSNDMVHIAWQDKNDDQVHYIKLNPSLDDRTGDAAVLGTITVVAEKALTSGDGDHPRLAIDSNDDIHIVWNDNGYDEFHYMKVDDSGNELIAETLFHSGSGHRSLDIALDSNNNPHITFNDDSDTSTYEAYYMMLDGSDGSTLIDATLLTPDDGDYTMRQAIEVDADDKVHIVWQDKRGSDPNIAEIYYTKLDPSLDDQSGDAADASAITLIDDTALTPDDGTKSSLPDIAFSGGVLHITWYESSDIHYMVLDTGGNTLVVDQALTTAGSVTTSTDTDWTLPRVNVAANGRAHVVWCDDRTGNYEVWYNVVATGLVITKTVDPATAAPGETITYTLVFFNAAPPLLASGVVITDIVPVSVMVTSVISSGVAITDTGVSPSYVWEVADLASGTGGIITITGQLSTTLAAGVFTNTAEIACAETEGDETNNSSDAPLTVQNVAPVADAGNNQTVSINATVTLDGSGSSDANGDALTYGWAQTGEPSVALSSATAESPTFAAPGSETVLTFTLTVTDSHGLADPTPDEVVITVTVPANEPPTATDDAVTTVEDQAITLNVVANDSDPDDDPLTVSDVGDPAHGTAAVGGQPSSVVYTPDPGFTGTDTFTYTASDGSLTDTAAVTVAVVEGDRAYPIDPTQEETITIDDHIQSGKFLSTSIEFPPGSVPDSTTMVFNELPYSKHDAPSGLYFAGLFFNLDAYVGADHQSDFTFTKPVTLTFYFSRLRRPSLKYWDGDGNTWSSDGITVIESSSTKMVVTINHLTEFTILGKAEPIYLPFIVKNSITAPDLVVQSITATGDDVQVVIENQGNAPVTDEFWVEVYINPNPAPTAVNQLWYDLGNQGMFWGVTSAALPLAPGGTITLTIGDAYYWPSLSRFDAPLAPGTPVYAQVDAWNEATTYGAILESHEITGDTYNNIGSTVSTAAVAVP